MDLYGNTWRQKGFAANRAVSQTFAGLLFAEEKLNRLGTNCPCELSGTSPQTKPIASVKEVNAKCRSAITMKLVPISGVRSSR